MPLRNDTRSGIGEVHVGGPRPLALDAVHPADDLERRASRARCATRGPTGQKVSNPLARPHWPSVFWRSRQVTSFTQV